MAQRWLERLRDTYRLLARNPFLGRARDEVRPGLRSFPVGRHMVFYYIQTGFVEIARVLHQRQDARRQFRPSRPPMRR